MFRLQDLSDGIYVQQESFLPGSFITLLKPKPREAEEYGITRKRADHDEHGATVCATPTGYDYSQRSPHGARPSF